MRKIPQKLKNELERDPYYKKCCLTGMTRFKIDWHHCFTFQGKQINEKWNILPIWDKKHSPMGHKDSVHNCKDTKDYCELIALRRADVDVFVKYKKANFKERLRYLEVKFK